MSSLKTVVTYSIRKQFEELLESGAFDDSILTRLQKKPMICGRLCDTEKYKDRLRKSENEYPNLITLFCSLNTDGFRKRGCARGEIWPIFLAAHDVAKGTGSFREYQSQFIILSGIMQTNTKLKPADFESFFERMKLELEEITKNPLKLKLGDNEFEVRIELLQSILDMDASKKIRGLPVWQSYDSCSLCNIEGKQIRTKNGRKICWYSKDESDEYDDSFLPESEFHSKSNEAFTGVALELLNTCLPPPWADGFDNLHIIAEGTSRDLMKDLLGNGSKTGFPIRKKIRVEWAAALSAANTPRGRSSASLIDPIQLSTRTGSEVQQLFDIAVPTLIVLQKTPTEWTVMLLLHWLVTRSVTDCHLTEQKCEQIDRIHPTLRQIVGKRFPSLFTMKFHYFIDHLTPSIQYHGSPSLSSASPFERLNQTLGRSSNSFTTRTLVNISNRFMAMKRAVQHCTSPLYQTRMDPPLTIKGSIGFNDEKNCNVTMGEDNEDLTRAESEVLKSGRFRSNLIFSAIMYKLNVHCSFSYFSNLILHVYIDFQMTSRRIQRGGGKIKGKRGGKATGHSVDFPKYRSLRKPISRTVIEEEYDLEPEDGKTVYKSPAELEKKYPHLTLYSQEDEDEHDSEMDYGNATDGEHGEEIEEYRNNYADWKPTETKRTYKRQSAGEGCSSYSASDNTQFSISRHLSNPLHTKSTMDKLKDAVREGNVLKIGSVITQGFSENSLTEMQIEEYIKIAPKPTLSLFQFHQQLEETTLSDRNALHMGQLFLTKMAFTESNTINKLKASVSSLSSSFGNQTKLALLEKRQLEATHVINPIQDFPRIDLSYLYTKSSLVGDCAFSQMTHFLTRTFKQVLHPAYSIWYYTYRPKCIRPCDKHFEVFPEEIAEKLLDFGYDTAGVFLPQHLLYGNVDPEDHFVKSLKYDDPFKEIERRRNKRENVSNTMKLSIGHMLNYLRDYHFSPETGQLDNCKLRSTCTDHLCWKDLKAYRDVRRANSEDLEDFDINDVIRQASKGSSTIRKTRK
ncbi:hypothetical protein B9Z55_028470 [Caenorhabditis nigoni]|nr:hypothetical protein B9Z55_028470 [Caenorhabditis nigoni]